MTGALILIGILVVTAVVLVIIGLRNPEMQTDRELQARLEEFSKTGEPIDLEKLELSQPFNERVVYPIARKLGELAIRFTPQNALNSISRQLDLAGNPGRLDPSTFMALQFIAAIGVGGLMLLLLTVGKAKWPTGQIILVILLFTILGFYLPQLQLKSAITKRQTEIRKSMPDALDLLTICVEAGLGFDAAMAKVVEKWQTQLSMAFARVIQEIQLGKLRREALKDMADHIGIGEMTSFVAAVIQSEQLGVSMAKVLRIQSDQMRVKRRQRAEEEAHKAPLKMLIPMALLIFPSLLIILLVPAGIRIMSSGIFGAF